MPFIPHTEDDLQAMKQRIGIADVESLFDEIPLSLRQGSVDSIPVGLSEMALTRLANARAQQDGEFLCFIGAGAYEHHIPAAVWDIASRGEFMTAYTPYQAEASQGTLQLIYEYQTMMASLMGLQVSNASLYDGASALAEAILMSVRLSAKKMKATILMPINIHPFYRQTVKTIVHQQGISLIDIPYDPLTGRINIEDLKNVSVPLSEVAALVIPQPNFFGTLEEADQLTAWAAAHDILSIALVNPIAMALLKPPGEWGSTGTDIACGEGQPLGIPLSNGGPYYGFLCCKKAHVRQMPGRIVGRTVDKNGKMGFVLTLQAREQHIRRAKATSNICTNQGLMVTASTIYLSLLGPQGLKQVALASHQRAIEMRSALLAIEGIIAVFAAPFFHEVVIRINQDAHKVLAKLAALQLQAGIALSSFYPELGQTLLLCATETKTTDDIHYLAQQLKIVLEAK